VNLSVQFNQATTQEIAMSLFGRSTYRGSFNPATGQHYAPPTQVERWEPQYDRDNSDLYRLLGAIVLAIVILLVAWWAIKAVVDDRNWTACEKGGVLCAEFARDDRVIAKQARTDAQALALINAGKAKDDAEQAAKLAADILARPRRIYGVDIPQTEVIMSGGGLRTGGGAVNSHHGTASWAHVCSCLQALGLTEGVDFYSKVESDGRQHALLTAAGKAKAEASFGGLAAASRCLN
jgi:hypothetical protein